MCFPRGVTRQRAKTELPGDEDVGRGSMRSNNSHNRSSPTLSGSQQGKRLESRSRSPLAAEGVDRLKQTTKKLKKRSGSFPSETGSPEPERSLTSRRSFFTSWKSLKSSSPSIASPISSPESVQGTFTVASTTPTILRTRTLPPRTDAVLASEALTADKRGSSWSDRTLAGQAHVIDPEDVGLGSCDDLDLGGDSDASLSSGGNRHWDSHINPTVVDMGWSSDEDDDDDDDGIVFMSSRQRRHTSAGAR